MQVKDLIGKKIVDIIVEITDFDHEGSIPLEQSHSCLVLSGGEIISIPYKESTEIEFVITIPNYQSSIFPKQGKNTLLSLLFSYFSDNQKIINRNIKYVQGQEIIGVYQFNDSAFAFDNSILELKSGYLIGEITMATKGTGHAGIWIFTSKQDMIQKFGDDFIQVF